MEERSQEFVVPYEAKDRGSMMVGELKSDSATFPDMLVQFSKVGPYSRKAQIHLYPRLEQVKQLYALRPPFSFRGEFGSSQEIQETWTAQGIWIKSGSRIGVKSPIFWSAPFGEIESLEIASQSKGSSLHLSTSTARFAANRCFLFQVLANPDEEDIANSKKYNFESRKPSFITVSDGAVAEVNRRVRAHHTKGLKEIKKDGYSVIIRDYKDADTVREDAEAIMILASLASRERTMFWHWSSSSGAGDLKRTWRFNAGKFPRRDSHHEPLLPRDGDAARHFMETAFPIYRSALHRSLFDGAVYALLAKDLVLEVRIARLFAGIQGALLFALQKPRGKSRPKMRELFDKFAAKFGDHFADLWPLLWDPRGGATLSDLRNAEAHGDTFSEEDFLALSYASENLAWTLERILLLALGWKVDNSNVSSRSLMFFSAHQWQAVQQQFKI
jgi:hypothetical protein